MTKRQQPTQFLDLDDVTEEQARRMLQRWLERFPALRDTVPEAAAPAEDDPDGTKLQEALTDASEDFSVLAAHLYAAAFAIRARAPLPISEPDMLRSLRRFLDFWIDVCDRGET